VPPSLQDLADLAARPVAAAGKLASRPMGLTGHHGPLDPLGLVDRLRGSGGLRAAVRDRLVMVTGASSGIGAAVALRVGEAGGSVVLVARGAEALEETAAAVSEAGGSADVRPCDLADMEALDAMARDVLADHGRIDILVNSAGRSIRRSVALSYDRFHDFERTMRLNYFAAVRLILRMLPGMRERGFGHIVNLSSVGVQARVPRFAGYIASKAALDAFSDAVQAEVLDDGVRFTTIHMPLVRTPMISPTEIYDRFPALTPAEAGDLVAGALIHRPRRVSPPFGYLAALADAMSPEAMDFVRNRGYHLFPDSRAAGAAPAGRAADAPGLREDALSRGAAAFARATRGVHW
jgi:NAD(P)-dependent dehydrogenase (short-subunit alcohol dehydrogenase family)